ncbi:uncharacterized protein DS421_20g686250 [Arachis hypogaea]|nr:uncharacterized protein DS421_20g686250 [Arachis hypogaea]
MVPQLNLQLIHLKVQLHLKIQVQILPQLQDLREFQEQMVGHLMEATLNSPPTFCSLL